MVQSVEHIGAKLQMQLFGNREILAEREIQVPLSWSPYRSITDIACPDGFRRNGTDRHSRKGGGIQGAQRCSVIGEDGRPANIVGTAVGDPRRLRKGDRAARLRCKDPRSLPAAKRISQSIPTVQPWEAVNPFGDEVVCDISGGRPSLTFDIVK